MDKTLVIVDMQDGFPSAHKKEVQEECIQLVKYFIRNNLPIIVLEYEGAYYGKTFECISKLYKRYPYVKILKKRKDNGSDQVHRFMRREHWGITKRDEIVICGVNIGACVYETTWGLLKKGYNVKVVKKACNCVGYRGGNRIWMEHFPVKKKQFPVVIWQKEKHVDAFKLVDKAIHI
jgi:nicotinamidase-related amidase